MDVARSALRILQEPEAAATPAENLASLEVRESQGFMPAFDAARLALRSGALEVRMISLEGRHEMPAWASEVHDAEAEGIVLDNGWGPLAIEGDGDKVTALRVRRCLSVYDVHGRFDPTFSDEERTIPCETVVLAIGQQADLSFLSEDDGVNIQPRGILQVDESLATSAAGVFAGGDVAFGPRILVEAVANGHTTARSIHLYLEGRAEKKVLRRFRVNDDWRMPDGYLRLPRQAMPVLPTNRRIGIAEVELGFDEEQGRLEGKRCLKCQVNTIFDGSKCILCNGCVDICPESCLRLVDLVQIGGNATYSELVIRRYGRPPEELAAGQAAAIIKDETICIRCGLCAQRCPTGAITMESLEQKEREVFE